MNPKMELWNKVCETDPNHTKRVNQRGGFTSIDAHYQILSATAVFGPVGIGWGYDVHHTALPAKDALLAVADVTLWHGNRANTFGPWRGMAEIVNTKGHLDDDAAKKATTDALTKGLSHLGFNADVFLGKFDDNKYVENLEKKFSFDVDAAIQAMGDAKEFDALKCLFAGYYKSAPDEAKPLIKSKYDRFKSTLTEGATT